MSALTDGVKRGDIKIVADPWTPDWKAEAADELTEAALKKAKNQVVAVVASNDTTAGGAIMALEKAGLAGKVVVSGQDANLDAVPPHRRRHADDDRVQAAAAARARRGVRRGAAGQGREGRRHDHDRQRLEAGAGAADDTISVTKELIDQIIISDKFHTRDQVYGAAVRSKRRRVVNTLLKEITCAR